MDIALMYDKATIAAAQCKGKYMETVAYYDNQLSQKLMEEQAISGEMNQALEQKQFEVYLQPKYNGKTNQSCGAEALVRWNHPKKGMIAPSVFIPVFEKNGFIYKLDYFVWETICGFLKKWMDQGKNPFPVSVNVSRVNIYNPHLVDDMIGLVKKYKIPARLLNLELTESAFIENQELVMSTMQRLREAGFVILMDDFGSGYSSLNILKDIDIDILKVDMKFLPVKFTNGKSEKIITSIIRMAKWLDLTVVVEGVETKEQLKFLKSIGCDYFQGYYFAKPMPVKEYEVLMEKQEEMESEPEITDAAESMRNTLLFEDLWKADSQINKLFEKITQPVAVYEYSEGQIELVRVNSAFYEQMGYTEVVYERDGIVPKYLDAQEWFLIRESFGRMEEKNDTEECEYRRISKTGQIEWKHLKLQPIAQIEKNIIVLGMFTDITEQMKLETEIEKYAKAP